jgi:hypothetical protein
MLADGGEGGELIKEIATSSRGDGPPPVLSFLFIA